MQGEFEMSNSDKHTGDEAALVASKVMQDGRTSDDSKSAAASALSQADQSSDKSTSDAVASKASDVLQSEDTGANSKKAAASVLSQKEADKS